MRKKLQSARKAAGFTQRAMADKLHDCQYAYALERKVIVCADGRAFKKYKNGLWYPVSGNKASGYCIVSVNINGIQKNVLIHRLVAELFIPNPYNFPQVNHIDGDKANNCKENLEWCDCSYNVRHSKAQHAPRYLTNLKFIRKCNKISLRKISRTLGIRQGCYQDIENAVRKPDNDTANSLELYFGMSIDFLLSECCLGEDAL